MDIILEISLQTALQVLFVWKKVNSPSWEIPEILGLVMIEKLMFILPIILSED